MSSEDGGETEAKGRRGEREEGHEDSFSFKKTGTFAAGNSTVRSPGSGKGRIFSPRVQYITAVFCVFWIAESLL